LLCENTTEGAGFTVMVKLCGAPKQPFISGVTVMVAVTGFAPVLIAVKEVISPEPEAASPIEGVLLVQLNTVLGTFPVKVMAVVFDWLHTVWLLRAAL
jgi:uncharacterized phage infection (PIP) family protein YhgE